MLTPDKVYKVLAHQSRLKKMNYMINLTKINHVEQDITIEIFLVATSANKHCYDGNNKVEKTQ